MDVPTDWEDRLPQTIQALLGVKLSQDVSTSDLNVHTQVKDLFSQGEPCRYEKILAGPATIPSVSTIFTLQSLVGPASRQGFHSIHLASFPKTLFPLWAAKYWGAWSAAVISQKGWFEAVAWLEESGQDRAEV